MRLITKQAVSAFYNGQNFKSGNTQVVSDGHVTEMYLHGNRIAIMDNETNELYITNAGWASNVTKERLNGLHGVNISQKNWQWYLNGKVWDGKMTKV